MTTTATLAGPHGHATRGIALMVLAMAAFSTMDAMAKYLTGGLSGIEVAWGRYVFHLLPLAIGAWALGGRAAAMRMVRSRHPVVQLLRGLALGLSSVAYI